MNIIDKVSSLFLKQKWIIYLILLIIALVIERLGKFYYILIPVVFYIFIMLILLTSFKITKSKHYLAILILISIIFIFLEGALSYYYYANKVNNYITKFISTFNNQTSANLTVLSDIQKMMYRLDEYTSHYYLFIFVVIIALILLYTSVVETREFKISLSPIERALYSLVLALFSVIFSAYFYEAHVLKFFIILLFSILLYLLFERREYTELILFIGILLGVSLGFYIITILF